MPSIGEYGITNGAIVSTVMTKSLNQFENVQFNSGNNLTERAGNHGKDSHRLGAVSEADSLNSTLLENEHELFNELAKAVRTIAYGSIVLTIHEGRLVEISKTIRLRKSQPGRKA